MSDNDEEEIPINEDRIEYSCPEHSSNILMKMNELRLSHSDTQLIVDSKIFNVHKLVLIVESSYFEELFKTETKEEIEISDITSDIMEVLINFMYTSAIEIGETNVDEIMKAAIFLKMDKVIEFGIKFLTKSLTVTNALVVYKTGKMHANVDLLNDVIKFISNNLEGVSATKDFLTSDFEDINNIFGSQYLMFSPEEDNYLAVLKWIKYDLDNRRHQLYNLISHLKFHVLSRNFLVKIIGKESLIRDDKQCFNKLVEIYEALLLPVEPKRTPSQIGRAIPDDKELIRTDAEDVDAGPNVKVFDEKVALVRIEFRLSNVAVERMKRMPPRAFTWRVEIHFWCDHFNAWDLLVKTHFTTRVPESIAATLQLTKRIRTKHLKIQVHEAPQNTFRISYLTPKPLQ